MGTIGVDFDNTIVCYHELFHRVALERSLIPPSVVVSKSAIRDYLRSQGQETEWTELQGAVYGPRLAEAEPFEGVLDFFAYCRDRDICCRIISHKTRYPARGPQYDLHAAAIGWLHENGILSSVTGLTLANVFLEESRLAKLNRIATEKCVFFIDDLPECLDDSSFPPGVERLLFDPGNAFPLGPYQRCGSWQDIGRFVFGALEVSAP